MNFSYSRTSLSTVSDINPRPLPNTNNPNFVPVPTIASLYLPPRSSASVSILSLISFLLYSFLAASSNLIGSIVFMSCFKLLDTFFFKSTVLYFVHSFPTGCKETPPPVGVEYGTSSEYVLLLTSSSIPANDFDDNSKLSVSAL